MGVLGEVACATQDIALSVIYGCPEQLDVFNLGCFGANFVKIIDNKWYQDYQDEILDDGWEQRTNAMAKCGKIARDKGYEGFATYNNGMCLMADGLMKQGVFNEYGSIQMAECPQDGLGNDVSLNLYAFADGNIAYDDLGCLNRSEIDEYNAQHNTDLYDSFVTFEGDHYLFADDHKQRRNAVSKCAQMANERGYAGFALFDGGECHLSNNFKPSVVNSIRSSRSNATRSCGTGYDNAYNVYTFPYVDLNAAKVDEGLSAVEISLIVLIPLLFIAMMVVGYLLFRRYKNKTGKGSQIN